jgi:amino acid transporter
MVFVAIITYSGWKLIKRTKIIPVSEVDLVWEKPVIDAYEEQFEEQPIGFWTEMLQLVTWWKRSDTNGNV